MFSKPDKYSFLVQLNFMLQRHALLLRWLSLGFTVVLERSHYDDRLFVDHHYQAGHISKEEYDAYNTLSTVLFKKIPDPDIFIFFDVKPEVSMQRIQQSENKGQRPKEFPNEDIKLAFVKSWYEKYNKFYNYLVSEKEEGNIFQKTRILKFDVMAIDTMAITRQVMPLLKD
jgi:deoxyadenosine/deoxycytidine kinase